MTVGNDPALVGETASEHASPDQRGIGREMAAAVLWTVLADVLIFRTLGFSGPALFFALVPVLFILGCPGLAQGPARKLTICLIIIVAARLIWAGSGWTILSAVLLTIALAMSAAGCIPRVLDGAVLAGRSVFDGMKRVGQYRLPSGKRQAAADEDRWVGHSNGRLLAWLLPLAAGVVFAAIFVFANPDLFEWVSTRVMRIADRFQTWVQGISIWELPFCIFALLIGVGLMRPQLPLIRIGPAEHDEQATAVIARSPFYWAFRNTLFTLIVLFAVYLSFEFSTLWKQDFPAGFYYAGYAHQGAAWLTFALALATAVLSLIFSGSMLRDDRVGFVRRLAWIWSAENLLLAAAVYNRLMIYVDFNGMTRMRTIGFFGMSVVVIGFCLVLYKIGRGRGFWWLVRSQLIALVLTMIVHSVFPVDYLIHRYNAAAVASGSFAPSVMIAVKPISDEGMFPLLGLVGCEDEIIRHGVLAMLAKRQREVNDHPLADWTSFQGSREWLRSRLREHEAAWTDFRNPNRQDAAIARFRDYAMQWY